MKIKYFDEFISESAQTEVKDFNNYVIPIPEGVKEYWNFSYNLVDSPEFNHQKDYRNLLNIWKSVDTKKEMFTVLEKEGCFGEFRLSYAGSSQIGSSFLNLLIMFSYSKREPPKNVMDKLNDIAKSHNMYVTQTKKDYYTV